MSRLIPVIMILLLFTLPSCSKEEVSPLKTTSQFKIYDSLALFPETSPPANAEEPLTWDFSKNRNIIYDVKQKIVNTFNAAVGPGGGQNIDITAKLIVKSKGSGTADVVWEILKTDINLPDGKKAPPIEQSTVVIKDVREDSSIPGGGEKESLMKLLFPLPPKVPVKGEVMKIPAEFPYIATDSVLRAKGTLLMTLVKYITVNKHVCAYFKLGIEVGEMKVPEEIEGEHKFLLKGKGFCCFDMVDRCFQSGRLAIIMSIRAKIPDTVSSSLKDFILDSDNYIEYSRNTAKVKKQEKPTASTTPPVKIDLSKLKPREKDAFAVLWSINQTEYVLRLEKGGYGSLAELKKTGLIKKGLLTGVSGYRFTITGVTKDTYQARAIPAEKGVRYFYIDQTDVFRVSEKSDIGPGSEKLK